MFDSITFFNKNPTDPSNPLDIGGLVECMLFYGKTIVVANASILRQLFTYFGINRVIELIEEELLEDPFLVKTPIVWTGNNFIVGNESEIWKEWIC